MIGTIQIILFFCHQCNNTLTFSRVFGKIISERACLLSSGTKIKKIKNYYSLLGRKCYELRKPDLVEKEIKKDKSGDPPGVIRQRVISSYKPYHQSTDVGSGMHPRFSVNNTEVLTDTEVDVHVASLLDMCNRMTERMARSNKDVQSLHLVQYFADECKEIPGIGPLKSQMMIQLFALFGLVPLEYYTFLPVHLNGGPGRFLKEEMGWIPGRNKNLLEWNVKIVSELQALYNKEFTYNMFENAACEISRNTFPNDLSYKIPSISEDPIRQKHISFDFKNERLQFYFRVDGNRSNNWRLQMYAGGKNKINVFATDKKGEPYLLSWTRAKSNGLLSRSTDVQVNLKQLWRLDNVLKSD